MKSPIFIVDRFIIILIVDALGKPTAIQYDELNRQIATVDANN